MDKILKQSIDCWKEITNIITERFCEKQGLRFEKDGWVGLRIGEVICISDYYLNFSDILYDIENDIDKGEIIEWYELVLEHQGRFMNYETYCINQKRPNTTNEMRI